MYRAAGPTLQGLPAEMRLKIYEQMSPPIDSRTADWKGVLISCKHLHYEMKHELLRSMFRYLEQIQAEWRRIYDTPLRITTPTTIAEIQKITVLIPNSYFRAREARFPAARTFPATLASLIRLQISQLTIGRYEDDETMTRTTVPVTEHSVADLMRDVMDFLNTSKPDKLVKLDDGTDCFLSDGTTIEKVVFEWGTLGGAFADEDLILPYYAQDKAPDRTVELIRDHTCGPATGAIWTRRQYTWYGQVVEAFWDEVKPVAAKEFANLQRKI